MEEGKRMFSIFAARMFEQRVLQAYREKVAQERQLQLLRELDDEDKITKDREMKRQNQNQKKKDKKRYANTCSFDLLQKTLNGFVTLGSRSRLRKRNGLSKLRIRLLRRLRLRLGRLLLKRKLGRNVKKSVRNVMPPRKRWMKKNCVRKRKGRNEPWKSVSVNRSEKGRRRRKRIK